MVFCRVYTIFHFGNLTFANCTCIQKHTRIKHEKGFHFVKHRKKEKKILLLLLLSFLKLFLFAWHLSVSWILCFAQSILALFSLSMRAAVVVFVFAFVVIFMWFLRVFFLLFLSEIARAHIRFTFILVFKSNEADNHNFFFIRFAFVYRKRTLL